MPEIIYHGGVREREQGAGLFFGNGAQGAKCWYPLTLSSTEGTAGSGTRTWGKRKCLGCLRSVVASLYQEFLPLLWKTFLPPNSHLPPLPPRPPTPSPSDSSFSFGFCQTSPGVWICDCSVPLRVWGKIRRYYYPGEVRGQALSKLPAWIPCIRDFTPPAREILLCLV